MRAIPLLALVASALLCAAFASALNVPVAPAGTLPLYGLSLSTGILGPPQSLDAISFFEAPPDTIMVSGLYPISNNSCDSSQGTISMAARDGVYCLVSDNIAYPFEIYNISSHEVGVFLLPPVYPATSAGGSRGGQATPSGRSLPPLPTPDEGRAMQDNTVPTYMHPWSVSSTPFGQLNVEIGGGMQPPEVLDVAIILALIGCVVLAVVISRRLR
jgi:hypothetical protein